MLGREANGAAAAGVATPALQSTHRDGVCALGAAVHSISRESASGGARTRRHCALSRESRRECLDPESGACGDSVPVSCGIGQAGRLGKRCCAGAAAAADAVCADARRGEGGAEPGARSGAPGGGTSVRVGFAATRGPELTGQRRGFRALRDHGPTREGGQGPDNHLGGCSAIAIAPIPGAAARAVRKGRRVGAPSRCRTRMGVAMGFSGPRVAISPASDSAAARIPHRRSGKRNQQASHLPYAAPFVRHASA